jgi:hypothetical protein
MAGQTAHRRCFGQQPSAVRGIPTLLLVVRVRDVVRRSGGAGGRLVGWARVHAAQ